MGDLKPDGAQPSLSWRRVREAVKAVQAARGSRSVVTKHVETIEQQEIKRHVRKAGSSEDNDRAASRGEGAGRCRREIRDRSLLQRRT